MTYLEWTDGGMEEILVDEEEQAIYFRLGTARFHESKTITGVRWRSYGRHGGGWHYEREFDHPISVVDGDQITPWISMYPVEEGQELRIVVQRESLFKRLFKKIQRLVRNGPRKHNMLI